MGHAGAAGGPPAGWSLSEVRAEPCGDGSGGERIDFVIRRREDVAAGRSPDGRAGGAEEDVGGQAAGCGEVGDAAVVSGEPLA